MSPSFPIREVTDVENELPNIGSDVVNPDQLSGGSWWVWKFGGSSVADYERMLRVVRLICDQLQQWEVDPPCELNPQSSFLASSPSPPVSRQTSVTPCAVTTSHENPFPLAQDHLAVISSAMSGVTDLLASAISKALSVRSKVDLDHVMPSLKSSRSMSDENVDRSLVRMASDKTRLGFLLEAKSELRRWSEEQAVSNQLENCTLSHLYGVPLIKLINIHMTVAECIKADYDNTGIGAGCVESGSTSARYRKRLPEIDAFQRSFFCDIIDIISILQSISLTGDVSDPMAAYVLGQGEIWTINLLHIILTRVVNNQYPHIATLKLNAREVLRLRRTLKPGGDLRPPMVRKPSPCRSATSMDTNKTTEDSSSLAQTVTETLSYNPSRRLIMQEQPSNRSSLAALGEKSSVDCEYDDHTEEYAIGPLQQANYLSRTCSSEDPYSTWAFPSWKTLPSKLYPPAGPISVVRYDAEKGGLPIIDWQASYKLMAKWFHTQEIRTIQRRKTQESLSARGRSGSGSVGTFLQTKSKSSGTRYILLVTGFICKTLDGFPATLQRNGSDTSAVAFASLLRAQGVTIWSDVAGVYTGDPRIISESEPLDYLSYEEALELAGIGAKVLHPASLLPCMHMQMPMLLKSTFKPEQRGTLIADFSHLRDEARLGKVVTKVSDVALLTLSNYPLTSVYRFASRFFETVERGGGKILLISQGASSSAISVALHISEVDGVLCAVQEEFRHDVEDFGSHLKVTVDTSCAVLSVVGRGQHGYVGALASWCNALKENNISIKAISQSSNELSTSFVVCKSQEVPGLVALHSVVTSVAEHGILSV